MSERPRWVRIARWALFAFGSFVIGYIAASVIVPTYVFEGDVRIRHLGVDSHNTVFHYDVKYSTPSEGQPIRLTIESEVPMRLEASDPPSKQLQISEPTFGAGKAYFVRNIIFGVPDEESLTVAFQYYVNPSPFHRLWLSLLLSLPVPIVVVPSVLYIRYRKRRTAMLDAKVEDAEVAAKKETEKAEPAVITAQARLDKYFDNNLQQVTQIFVTAIVVMAIGFCFLAFCVVLSLRSGDHKTGEIVTGAAGALTEFLGATLMVVYRRTMTQATEFTSILERLTTVGSALRVLDSIPETELKSKNHARSRVIELLLLMNVRSKTKGQEHEKKASSTKKTDEPKSE
jgi:hypothetical protein